MRGAALSQPYFWYDSICWSYADFATPYIIVRKKASNCCKKWTTVYNYYRFQLSHSMTEVLVQYHESQIPATIQLMHSPSFADDCSVDESPPRAVTHGVQGHLCVKDKHWAKEISPGCHCTQTTQKPRSARHLPMDQWIWLLKTLFSCLFCYSSSLKSLVARIYTVLCRGTGRAFYGSYLARPILNCPTVNRQLISSEPASCITCITCSLKSHSFPRVLRLSCTKPNGTMSHNHWSLIFSSALVTIRKWQNGCTSRM